MKKIGIITIIDNNNYGNRLQNYAVQEVLKSIGYDPTTILNKIIHKELSKSLYEKIKDLLQQKSFNQILEKCLNKMNNYVYKSEYNKRINRFIDFSNKYIKSTSYVIDINNIPEGLQEDFDFFVVGSDQVWNPYFRKGSEVDFLNFAPKSKRISYAASFGITDIPIEYREKYTHYLKEFKDISVREQAGLNIIKELTGRDATLLIDPTLMLSSNEWIRISSKHENKPLKKYILTYYLGEIDKEYEKYINNLAENNNYEIVNLAKKMNKKYYTVNPSEFIDYINDCEIFFTDSFHGVIFSILMNTPFIACERKDKKIESMNSRMSTLLSTFKLTDRVFENIDNIQEVFDIDYSDIKNILDVKRSETINFLKEALEI